MTPATGLSNLPPFAVWSKYSSIGIPMSTAELIDELPAHQPVAAMAGRAKAKPPLALRPLHRMWRKTIDEIQVSALDLPVRGLPAALRGLVACQISDFHVDRDEDLARLASAVEAINRNSQI